MPSDLAKPRTVSMSTLNESYYYIVAVFLLMLISSLYIGRDFLTPVTLAFILATTLNPVVRYMAKWGISSAIAATILIMVSAAVFAILAYLTSGPIAQMISDAPQISARLQAKLYSATHLFEKAIQASTEVDAITQNVSDAATNKVVVAQPGILSEVAGNLISAGTTLAVTFVLSLFLLASGTMFHQKIIQLFPNLRDKKTALRIVYDIQAEISRYLFTITLINTTVGIIVGLGMWSLGVPHALVWGVASALLNFLPYVGALVAIALVGAISIVNFDNFFYSLMAPAFILAVHVVEGQFLTPTLLGRRLELNAVCVFISISFWAWLWGLVGVLLAVPILIIIKITCDNVAQLRWVSNLLTAGREKYHHIG